MVMAASAGSSIGIEAQSLYPEAGGAVGGAPFRSRVEPGGSTRSDAAGKAAEGGQLGLVEADVMAEQVLTSERAGNGALAPCSFAFLPCSQPAMQSL